MLPVHAYGAKLSVGDLHFPTGAAEDCDESAQAGWIDLRINLTKRGVERFLITSPLLIPQAPWSNASLSAARIRPSSAAVGGRSSMPIAMMRSAW